MPGELPEQAKSLRDDVLKRPLRALLSLPAVFSVVVPSFVTWIALHEWLPSWVDAMYVAFIGVYTSLPLVLMATTGLGMSRANVLKAALIETIAIMLAALCIHSDRSITAVVVSIAGGMLVVGILLRSLPKARTTDTSGWRAPWPQLPLVAVGLAGLVAPVVVVWPVDNPATTPSAYAPVFGRIQTIAALDSAAREADARRDAGTTRLAIATVLADPHLCRIADSAAVSATLLSTQQVAIQLVQSPQSAWTLAAQSAGQLHLPPDVENVRVDKGWETRTVGEPCAQRSAASDYVAALNAFDAQIFATDAAYRREMQLDMGRIFRWDQQIGRFGFGLAFVFVTIGLAGSWRRARSPGDVTDPTIRTFADLRSFYVLAATAIFVFAAPYFEHIDDTRIDVRDAFGMFTMQPWFLPRAITEYATEHDAHTGTEAPTQGPAPFGDRASSAPAPQPPDYTTVIRQTIQTDPTIKKLLTQLADQSTTIQAVVKRLDAIRAQGTNGEGAARRHLP